MIWPITDDEVELIRRQTGGPIAERINQRLGLGAHRRSPPPTAHRDTDFRNSDWDALYGKEI